jgi:hypothetical protein
MRPTRSRLLPAALAATATAALVVAGPASADTNCDTAPWATLDVAHEIINTATVTTDPEAALPTYKGAGTNPVSDSVWNNGYAVPSPYIRNTTRNLQFNESQFIASPGAPVCQTNYITTSDGYTWGAMSTAINAMWPYRRSDYTQLSKVNAYYAGNMVTTPPAGVVKVTANFKAQNMEFWANQNGVAPGTPGAVPLTRFFIIDRWGNEYIMHASGQSDPTSVQSAFNAAVLPPGWKKVTRTLKNNLFLHPAEGSDGTFHYLVFRDSTDNTYHQTKWSNRGNLEAMVDGSAMPIWGGQDANVIKGDQGDKNDDTIHGAGGNDTLSPGRGKDEVWGDAGLDTVNLSGAGGDWRLAGFDTAEKKIVLRPTQTRGRASQSTKTLYFVERVRVGGQTYSASKIMRMKVGQTLSSR